MVCLRDLDLGTLEGSEAGEDQIKNAISAGEAQSDPREIGNFADLHGESCRGRIVYWQDRPSYADRNMGTTVEQHTQDHR